MFTLLSHSRQFELSDALVHLPRIAVRGVRNHAFSVTIAACLLVFLSWAATASPIALDPRILIAAAVALALAIATGAMIRLRRRVTVLENALLHAEAETCSSHLPSHFVFNALNTVGGLVISDQPRVASRALGQLGDLMRRTLRDRNQAAISLADELAFVRDYISLQRLRFGERLVVTEAVDEAALNASIPPLTIQLLVENAIQHGALTTVGRDRIGIRVHLADDDLVVEVVNGRRAGSQGQSGFGIGLDAVRRRLDQFGGAAASLTITRSNDSFRARVVVPQSLEERR